MTNEMTAEEAIMFIKEVLPFYLKPEQTTEWEICQQALDKAIQALEAQEDAYERGFKDGIKYGIANTELD